MKFALCLRGMHYYKTHNYNTDYRNSIKNYYDYIIDPLIKLGHEVDIFGFTYYTEYAELLKKDYNFKELHIYPDSLRTSSNTFNRQLKFHIEANTTIQEYENNHSIKYDYIINTRFDLIFNINIIHQNLELFKINIPFKHLSGNCDDNYFIIPRYLLNDFDNACKTLLNSNRITHELNRCFNDNMISFMYTIYNEDELNKTEYKYFKFGRIVSN